MNKKNIIILSFSSIILLISIGIFIYAINQKNSNQITDNNLSTTNTQKTQKEFYGELRDLAVANERVDLMDFIDKKVEQLNRKTENKGLTATQKANIETMDVILDTLRAMDEKARISDLQDANKKLATLTNQKISALLKNLVDNNQVTKVIEKKIAYFKIA